MPEVKHLSAVLLAITVCALDVWAPSHDTAINTKNETTTTKKRDVNEEA